MKNKKYLFLLLILLLTIISISAVNAADDFTSDISNIDDNQEINLEENIQGDLSANQEEIEEISLEKDPSANDDNKIISSADKTGDSKKENSKEKVKAKSKVSKKEKAATKNKSKKEKTNAKKSSKKKTAFKTIGKNSKDKATVKKIQKALKKNGYYLRYKGHYLMVDGWFGPCTERSVKQFQKAKKLKVTGKVDEKTAEKLKIIDKSTAQIKFENDNTFKGEYKSGKSFDVQIVDKKTGKGIETTLRVDYYKNGKKIDYEYYCTGEDGMNYITPDDLKVGTYTAKVSCDEPNIIVEPKYKTIIVKKTSIIIKAKDISSGNEKLQLKANLKFKNNQKVNAGKVKFTVDGKSYIVKVHNGVATKTIKVKNLNSSKYEVTFLGTKNIKAKSVTGKIA